MDTHWLFKLGEPIALCKQALAGGPKTTRDLARHIMAAKGLDTAQGVGAGVSATS